MRSPIDHLRWLLPATILVTLSMAAACALGGTLRVHVLDARDGSPLAGAFVQSGPAPGSPFAHNWGNTGPDGSIVFDDPALSGFQTVTAGATGFALLSVMDAAQDSITLSLHPQVASDSIFGPKAQVSGTTTGIQIQNNDGKFDVGLVYPAMRLASLVGQGAAPIEVPPDTVSFPVIGTVVLPGNVVMPSQTEFLFVTFSKPNYHFFVPDHATYDFVVLAARMPVASLAAASLDAVTPRRVGVERQIEVNGNRTLTPNCDLALSNALTVTVPEAPPGCDVQALAVADVNEPGGMRTLIYDLKTALADTLDHFTLSGLNPAGDLSTSTPYIAAVYGDSSAADSFQAGVIDRAPLVLPTSRTVGGFFLLPALTANNDRFTWSDVARPGIAPDPTWAVASFRLAPLTPGDGSVTTRTLWQVWTTAGPGSFVLPRLAGGAPGGLVDPSGTPEPDRLIWDELLCDASGVIQDVLEDPFSTATRFSRRSTEIGLPVLAVPIASPSPTRLGFTVVPNPGRGVSEVSWTRPPAPGEPVRWMLTDATGRRVGTGRYAASGHVRERAPWSSGNGMAPGVYWVRLAVRSGSGAQRLIVTP